MRFDELKLMIFKLEGAHNCGTFEVDEENWLLCLEMPEEKAAFYLWMYIMKVLEDY